MTNMKTTRLMISAVLLGLVLSMLSIGHASTIDAGPPELPAAAIVEVGELAEPEADSPAEAAQEPPQATDSVEDALGTASEVVSDVRAGDWRHAIAGILVLVMLGLGKARDRTNWFSGDRAGAGLVIVLGLAGGLVTTLYAEGPLDWRLFLGSAGVVTSSVGLYTLAKKLFFPKAKPVQ